MDTTAPPAPAPAQPAPPAPPAAASASASVAYCLKHGLGVYLEDAAQLYAAAAPAQEQTAPAAAFMAAYLSAVVSAQHVVWRHYAYVSGTHENRKAFLLAAAQCWLLPALTGSPGQRISLGDAHSLLQLLCPDLPASVIKNAWSAAATMQEWQDYQAAKQQQQQQQSATTTQPVEAEGLVQLPILWQCLEVTWLYEHCLLCVRREAFGKDKRCISLDKLEEAIQRASSSLPERGWPVPPARCWKVCVAQASRAATHPDFAFRDLVRALCCCQELVQSRRRELQETAASAAATSAAFAASSAD